MKANVIKNPRRNREEELEVSIPGTSVHIPLTHEEARDVIEQIVLLQAKEEGLGDDGIARSYHNIYLTVSPLAGPKVRFSVSGSREQYLNPTAARELAYDLLAYAQLAEIAQEAEVSA